jgi:hypothetical protein
VPIDPAILTMENDFRIRRNPLSQVRVGSDDSSSKGDNIPSSPLGKMGLNDRDSNSNKEGDDMDLCSTSRDASTVLIGSISCLD